MNGDETIHPLECGLDKDGDKNYHYTGLTKREYFAASAMIAVMGETQEMRVATAWDWIKSILQAKFGLSFLTVKYKEVNGAYNDASQRCLKYADALIEELNK